MDFARKRENSVLSVIFKNPERASKKLNISTVAIYGWLKGSTPKLSTMMKVHKEYGLRVTLEYMYNFFTLISSLLPLEDDLERMLKKIEISALDGDDKHFLSEYIKAKHWKKYGNE